MAADLRPPAGECLIIDRTQLTSSAHRNRTSLSTASCCCRRRNPPPSLLWEKPIFNRSGVDAAHYRLLIRQETIKSGGNPSSPLIGKTHHKSRNCPLASPLIDHPQPIKVDHRSGLTTKTHPCRRRARISSPVAQIEGNRPSLCFFSIVAGDHQTARSSLSSFSSPIQQRKPIKTAHSAAAGVSISDR
ncbi:hypothetical protein ACLOJK_006570, partial [Asimina triloba]